jgi:F420-non-reducing hydrogenase iron-sulfur subunit
MGREVVLFGCRHTGTPVLGDGKAMEMAGLGGCEYRELTCLGALDPLMVLRALDEGADAVVVVGCYVGRCRHLTGSQRAMRALDHVGKVLEEVGVDSDRIGLVLGSPIDPEGIIRELRNFTEGLGGEE